MDRASVNGITLEYETAGTGDPIVFIHGALIADTFRPLLAEPILSSRYRLIMYHRRGYTGSSQSPGPTTMEQQANDCRALLHHLDVERAHVVGHSFGGCIALQLALDSPGLVHSLALLEPALMVGESAKSYREALQSGVQRYQEAGAETVVDEFLEARLPNYRDVLERVLPGAFDQAVADAGTTFEVDIGALNWNFGELEAQHIRQPVLSVLGGESEKLWKRFGETHRALLDWCPQAEGYVLPGATHFLQIQNSHDMAEALAAFCAHHPIDDPV